jgi:hypothetical protein
MAFPCRRHKPDLQAEVDAIGEDDRRWLTDQSMRHGKVRPHRPHRIVSSAIRLASKNEEGIWTTVYGFCGNAGGCMSRCPRPVWIRSRARLSHSVGRGRFPKSPALRLMRTRWGIDGGGDGLCWCEQRQDRLQSRAQSSDLHLMKAYLGGFQVRAAPHRGLFATRIDQHFSRVLTRRLP